MESKNTSKREESGAKGAGRAGKFQNDDWKQKQRRKGQKDNKGLRGDKKQTRDSSQRAKVNDWTWYAADKTAVVAAASLPYTWPTGNRLDLGSFGGPINDSSVPGIMAIAIDPQVGFAQDVNDPVNIASRNIYSFVRHANSGHSNYDSPDLMLYLLAMDSCYSYLEFIKRAYATARIYNPVNKYYPQALVEAMGVDFNSVMTNLADLNFAINTLAVKLGAMCVPATMPYVLRHQWMYQGVYADGQSPRGQVYMYVPRSFFKFKRDPSSQAGMLERIYLRSENERNGVVSYTVHDIMDHVKKLDDMINAVLGEEDHGIMSGDILKAYGAENVIHVAGAEINATTVPVYSAEVLTQIQNATLIGPCSGDITQTVAIDTGYLVSKPAFRHFFVPLKDTSAGDPGLNALFCDRFITFDFDGIQPENTMVATRLTAIAARDSYDNESHTFRVDCCGSETAAYAQIFYYDWSSGTANLVSTPLMTASVCFAVANGAPYASGDLQSAIDNLITKATQAPGKSDMTYFNAALKGITDAIAGTISNTQLFIAMLSKFRQHPYVGLSAYAGLQVNTTIDLFTLGGTSDSYKPMNGQMFDLNNYAIVDERNLANMSQTAMLSEFAVTQYGRKG